MYIPVIVVGGSEKLNWFDNQVVYRDDKRAVLR